MVQWQDFDFEGKVKIPLGYYLVLLYLLRAYALWVVSLTYREDPTLILSLVYSDKSLFFYSLVIGIPAILTFTLFSLKSQKEKPWFARLWRKQHLVLSLALVLDLGGQFIAIVNGQSNGHWSQILLLMTGFYLTWYWIKSLKVKRFFGNWLL
ncbi:MAG: DUF2919 family protein [Gammaproteobacteria bacterium]|nr:DUF2919 family protein [Gammaproteobacteria bacterium]